MGDEKGNLGIVGIVSCARCLSELEPGGGILLACMLLLCFMMVCVSQVRPISYHSNWGIHVDQTNGGRNTHGKESELNKGNKYARQRKTLEAMKRSRLLYWRASKHADKRMGQMI
jgi:predicted GNAT family acetyltransferase